MGKNVSKAIVKKNAVKELNSILKSPFAVMNLINKNRESENIKKLMDLYGIDKLELSMLLHVTTGGAPVFCKLQKVSDIEYLNGDELKVIKIGQNYFEYVPIKFSVSAFFQSLESAMKVTAEAEKAKKQAEKAKAKREKRSADNTEKRIANRAAKVAAKAKELKEKFADLPDNMIMQLAEEFFKAA
jgi:hypothetical protein